MTSRKLVSVSHLSIIVVLALFLTSVYSYTRGDAPRVQAAVPATLNFQGRLLSSSGNLVPDGNYSIEFKLYNASSSAGSSQGSCAGDANCLWTETRTGGNQVEIKNGYFSAYLGDITSLPTNIWDQQLWLTMNVHNGSSWDGEMTPRIRLTSVPYAFQAKSAETLAKNTGSFTGTVDFENMTADRRFLFPDTSLATTADPGTICVFNGSVSNCPAATGSEYYIHNDLGLQSEGNFNIQARDSGVNGTVAGIFRGADAGQTVDLVQFQATNGTVLGAVTATGNLEVAGSVDVRSAGTLSLGTATATAITIGDAGVTTTNAGALTVTELGTFNGGLTAASNLTVTQAGNVAFQRNTTDYTATGPQDDINFGTGALFRITSASALTINGIAGGADGRIITLVNASSNPVTIANSGSGTAANHVVTGTGGALSVPVGSSIQLAYDSSSSVWRVIGGTATGGGGANQQLSNLSGTIAINASLTPNDDNTLDLGSTSYSWRTLYADTSVLTPVVDTVAAGVLAIGTTNATDIIVGHDAGTFAVDATNFDLSTAGVITLAGGQSADITTQTNANLTLQANGSGTIVLNDTVTTNGTVNFNGVATDITTGTNEDLTIDANGTGLLQLSDSVVVAADQTITLTGGTTVTRNAIVSPVDGMLFFDTSTQQLLIYAGGKWRADRSEVITVAASDSSQADKDAADFVADGNGGGGGDGDQVEINQALSAAAGKKVVLFAGTYTADATILIPNNTTLTGVNRDVVIVKLDVGGGTDNLIEDSGTSGISIENMTLDGDLGSGGTQHGIAFDGTTIDTISNIAAVDWGYGDAVALSDAVTVTDFSNNNISSDISLAGSASVSNFTNNQIADISITSSTVTNFTNNTTQTVALDDSYIYIATGNSISLAAGNGLSLTNNSIIGTFTGNITREISITDVNTSTAPMLISDNTIYVLNATADAISLSNADNVRIIGNIIVDAATTSGYAIDIDATTAGVYIADNTLGGLAVNNLGTNTVYGGQVNASGNFIVQPAGTIELIANTNVTGTLAASVAVHAPLFDTATAVALGIGTTNATNISIGHNAGTLAIDQTNFDLSTAGVITLAGGQAADITTQANQNLTVVANGSGTISLDDTVSISNTLTLRDGTTDITTGTDENLTVVANGNGIIELNDTVTVAGNFTVTQAGNVAFQRNTNDYTATGTQSDIDFGTGALFRITSASALTINSIAGGADGRIMTLVNASSNPVTVANETGATAGNRILTGTGGTTLIPVNGSIQLAYDSSASRWRIIGGAAIAGGSANQQLSNLSGTIAVNASLNPGTDGTLDLGSAGNSWQTLYADTSVLTPLVGRASAGTLSIGTDANSTAVSISRTGITSTVYGALTVNEATQLSGGLTITNGGNLAVQRNVTDYTATGSQTDVNFGTGALFRITSASPVTINSVAGGADGRIITLMNASSSVVTLLNDDGATGTAGNRIITGSGINSLIPAGGSVQLAYDSGSNRWRIIGSSGGGSIQLQASTPGTAQTGNFNVSGTGIAGTALQSPLFDTATAVALGIGTTNATNISIGHNAGTLAIDQTNFDLSTAGVITLAGGQAFDLTTQANQNLTLVANGSGVINLDDSITAGGNITFATGANRQISVAAAGSGTAGYNLTMAAGAAGSGGAAAAGGVLNLQGGAAAGTGNANGGAVTIAGGAGVGTGTQGLINLSTTAFSSASVYTASSTPPTINDIPVADVNLYATIPVNATTATAIVSVPDPTISSIGRILYITARDTSTDFTLRLNAASLVPIDIAMKKNSTATLIWNGDEWTAAGASSSTDLQSAYNNTLTSAGGAEIVLNPVGGNADGFTIRNNGTTPIVGGLLEVQTSTGSNLLSINNNATEYAVNGGAEAGTGATFTNGWTNTTGGTVDRWTTTGDYIATGVASVRVQASDTNHGARNTLSTALTTGMTYSVSFAARGVTNFNSLQVLYSPDGTTSGTTTCATGKTVTQGGWTRILCTFVASGTINGSNAILIRQTDSTTRTFYIDNLSVNVSANMSFAADGSVNSALGSNWGDYDTGTGSSTVTRTTSVIYDTDGAVSAVITANSNLGVRNNMSVTPAVNTQYLVSFYARVTADMSGSLKVGFLPAGGTGLPVAAQECVDYNTQSVTVAGGWTKITCLITTPSSGISDPDLVIYQTDATARTVYIDALTINLNTNNSNNVQVGGGNEGGPTTLLTLDRASSAPIAANNDAYLGSMYYDTTTGRIQCYEADGWGACGSSPDNIVTLTPEYTGAVLGGPGNGGAAGIGVMTSEFCSNEAGVLTLGSLCANHEARNYYHWTSPQATEQVYSIYVAYKLPTTFKAFNDSNTIKLTALSDDLTNAVATLQVFRKKADGTGIIACGASAQTINSSINTWQQTPYDSADETTCSFAGGDNIIFKIDMKSRSNGNIYVENLDFVYNNN